MSTLNSSPEPKPIPAAELPSCSDASQGRGSVTRRVLKTLSPYFQRMLLGSGLAIKPGTTVEVGVPMPTLEEAEADYERAAKQVVDAVDGLIARRKEMKRVTEKCEREIAEAERILKVRNDRHYARFKVLHAVQNGRSFIPNTGKVYPQEGLVVMFESVKIDPIKLPWVPGEPQYIGE